MVDIIEFLFAFFGTNRRGMSSLRERESACKFDLTYTLGALDSPRNYGRFFLSE